MRRTAVIAAVSTAALAGAALAQGGAAFHDRDDGRIVGLTSPDFTVELPRKAGTGYRWNFMDGHEVLLVSQEAAPIGNARPGEVGLPVSDRFQLRATAATGDVEIGLFPPGSPGAPSRIWRLSYHRAYARAQDWHRRD